MLSRCFRLRVTLVTRMCNVIPCNYAQERALSLTCPERCLLWMLVRDDADEHYYYYHHRVRHHAAGEARRRGAGCVYIIETYAFPVDRSRSIGRSLFSVSFLSLSLARPKLRPRDFFFSFFFFFCDHAGARIVKFFSLLSSINVFDAVSIFFFFDYKRSKLDNRKR